MTLLQNVVTFLLAASNLMIGLLHGPFDAPSSARIGGEHVQTVTLQLDPAHPQDAETVRRLFTTLALPRPLEPPGVEEAPAQGSRKEIL